MAGQNLFLNEIWRFLTKKAPNCPYYHFKIQTLSQNVSLTSLRHYHSSNFSSCAASTGRWNFFHLNSHIGKASKYLNCLLQLPNAFAIFLSNVCYFCCFCLTFFYQHVLKGEMHYLAILLRKINRLYSEMCLKLFKALTACDFSLVTDSRASHSNT